MNGSELDHMIEFAIGELAAGDPERIRGVVRHIAQRWPEQKALMICFALTSAAAQIEDVFTDGRGDRRLPIKWQHWSQVMFLLLRLWVFRLSKVGI